MTTKSRRLSAKYGLNRYMVWTASPVVMMAVAAKTSAESVVTRAHRRDTNFRPGSFKRPYVEIGVWANSPKRAS